MNTKDDTTTQWHAVILCDSTDDGRTPLNSQRPMAGWPVLDGTSLERVCRRLIQQAPATITVCYSGSHPFWQEMESRDFGGRVRFIKEDMPVGSAGAVRQALQDLDSGIVVAMSGHVLDIPSCPELVTAHLANDADFSLILNPDEALAGIYVCNTAMINYIPDAGYCDIKELWVPLLIQAGKTVRPLSLRQAVHGFSDWRGYREAVLSNLDILLEQDDRYTFVTEQGGGQIWSTQAMNIPDSCRVYGKVAVMPEIDIGEDVVLVGPSIIGPNTTIGKSSIISHSILWSDTAAGEQSLIKQSVVGSHSEVPTMHHVQARAVAGRYVLRTEAGLLQKPAQLLSRYSACIDKIKRIIGPVGAFVLLAGCFLWSYWSDLQDLWRTWLQSDEYSSGLLVPFLACYILWLRRDTLKLCRIEPWLWGLVVLAGAQLFRLFGLYYMYGSAERLSIVLSIWALTLVLGGKAIFKKVFTVLLFLLLMLPWPNRVQLAIALPLQTLATDSAVFCLETLGYEVIKEGHVLHIGQTSVAVAEACNGLRMITAFFVIAALVVLIIERPFWEKCLIMISSLPIALICNTIRLTLTSISFTLINGDAWEQAFHDFGGYAMMPTALGIIVLELWLFKLLTTDPAEKKVMIVRRRLEPSEEISR